MYVHVVWTYNRVIRCKVVIMMLIFCVLDILNQDQYGNWRPNPNQNTSLATEILVWNLRSQIQHLVFTATTNFLWMVIQNSVHWGDSWPELASRKGLVWGCAGSPHHSGVKHQPLVSQVSVESKIFLPVGCRSQHYLLKKRLLLFWSTEST